MPKIVLTNVTKRWGSFYAVENLNLVIDDNSFVTLLGPSGCGKTTTLRMIAGLETPTSGKIEIGDTVVFDSERGINIPANKRRVGFLFQNYALWPNMTVYQNISFGLSNVKEELPLVDYELKNTARLIEILDNPDKIIDLVNDCKDKKGDVDKDKAYLKFIDTFFISMFTAKKLYGIYQDIKSGPNQVKDTVQSLTKDLNLRVEENKKNNLVYNAKYEQVKDGYTVKKERKLNKEEIDLKVRAVSRIVKVGMFMDRYPAELSGGQQQRVAIARTLAPEPSVLFMDEPLSNLDAKLRLEMRYELQRLHVETGSTFVYVTHDQMEAMTLATKICLIDNGVLQMYDAPLTVYNKPNNLFVADFVGNPSINFIEAKGFQNDDGSIELSFFDDNKALFAFENKGLNLNLWFDERNETNKENERIKKERLEDKKYVEKGNKDERFKYHIQKVVEEENTLLKEYEPVDGDFVIGIRPEFLKIEDNGSLSGIIYGAMPTGMESTIKVRLNDFLLTGVIFGATTYPIGSKVNLDITGNEIALFDRPSGRLIGIGSLNLKK